MFWIQFLAWTHFYSVGKTITCCATMSEGKKSHLNHYKRTVRDQLWKLLRFVIATRTRSLHMQEIKRMLEEQAAANKTRVVWIFKRAVIFFLKPDLVISAATFSFHSSNAILKNPTLSKFYSRLSQHLFCSSFLLWFQGKLRVTVDILL